METNRFAFPEAAVPSLRFSLRTLFLTLLIATLVGSNVFTSYRLEQLLEENVSLRKETGRLVVKDPARFNVLAIPTYEDLTWRWRVHVPPGGERICLAGQEIPQTGFAAGYSSTTLAPGDYLLTATVRRNHLGDWTLTVGHLQGSTSTVINAAHSNWLERQTGASGWSSSQVGQSEVAIREPGQKLELLRVRAMVQSPGRNSASNGEEPAQGVMIWLEDPR